MTTELQATHVFYSAKLRNAVDEVNPKTGRSMIGGYTLEETRERYPDAVLMTWEDAIETIERAFTTDWQEIDRERFYYLLEVLPPVGWRTVGGVESFKMLERISGNITEICARHGDRYWTRNASIFTPPEEIAAQIRALEVAS